MKIGATLSEISLGHKAYWGLAKALKTEGAAPTPALKRPHKSIAFDDREKAECLADSIEHQCSDNPPYNEAALSERTRREWFQKCENGDFDVEDKDRSERPKIYDDAEFDELLEEDSSQTLEKSLIKQSRIVLPHPPYSPDIAPSDYRLIRSMAYAMSEQRFTSYEDTKNWADSWIASKGMEFFRLGIRTLPERWKKVVASDGQYFN
ncbi:Mariner Mos1 transposase [Eumeta japonica]|uniref:Mariner Mos1 transposase n=1 Tax=Eumeta variegata TaxID=151549 RepID=A0A4C1SW73_EUMVA|nr:Mariner Mos1 transposase [Eumeta japonica]